MRTLILVASMSINIAFIVQNWQRNVVVSVPDGDSLQLHDGRRVRLVGLDAPERGRCMADEAREALMTAVKGRHIRLKNVVTDDYGRQLAHVIIEDFPSWISYMRYRIFGSRDVTNNEQAFPYPDPYLNRMMVSRGLARYSGATIGEYHDTLKTALTKAKEHKLGIWSEECRKTTNPDCAIKGNIRAVKKTYILPNCGNYDQTIIDTSYGDRWFCTEEDAVKSGFMKATGCSIN